MSKSISVAPESLQLVVEQFNALEVRLTCLLATSMPNAPQYYYTTPPPTASSTSIKQQQL
jgi:hypothetical protein